MLLTFLVSLISPTESWYELTGETSYSGVNWGLQLVTKAWLHW